jgi:hypothetical protein
MKTCQPETLLTTHITVRVFKYMEDAEICLVANITGVRQVQNNARVALLPLVGLLAKVDVAIAAVICTGCAECSSGRDG